MNTIQSDEMNSEIVRVEVKPLQFFKDEPDLYFIQMETQFRNARILSENIKYDHVIASLDPQYFRLVSDIIRNPPIESRYTELKQRIIEEFTNFNQNEARIDKSIDFQSTSHSVGGIFEILFGAKNVYSVDFILKYNSNNVAKPEKKWTMTS